MSHQGHADALVVGGGPAGLSAALYLARYNRSVIVFDRGHGRSTHHQTNHNYLGFVDGVTARRLRELGAEQLGRYPHAHVAHHLVDHVAREADGSFTAHAQGHTWTASVVVLATGVLDHYPHFPSWEEYVGTSMFWCIACDGYENRGKDILVVGHTDAAAGEALQLHSLTDRVRLLTNSHTNEIGPTFSRRLDAAGIPLIHDRLAGAVGTSGRLAHVLTDGGLLLELEALFSIQGATPETRLAAGLGVPVNADGYVLVDSEQKTAVPGVYAAGDITAVHSHQVTTAVHEGAQAASAANYYLYPPELKG
ncbi:MAG: thioredoxin reductase [Nocardioidaceae bacterium]|jgi:thioredoxin reductase (NADPH)|nr:thioredoxin reductase [Nocardioidaceae bacterium]